MIKAVCSECGAVGAVTYPTFCDACEEQIYDTEESVTIQCEAGQLHFHSRCAKTGVVQCSICGAEPQTRGSAHIIHDRGKHLVAARKPPGASYRP